MRRFFNNSRRLQNQRELGKLTAAELQTTEGKSSKKYKEMHSKLKSVQNNQPLPRISSLLQLKPVMIEGTLRSNTMRYSTDLSAEVKVFGYSAEEKPCHKTDRQVLP